MSTSLPPNAQPLIAKLESIFPLTDEERAALTVLPMQVQDIRADQDSTFVDGNDWHTDGTATLAVLGPESCGALIGLSAPERALAGTQAGRR